MDEFAMGSFTENSAFGPTRNPWDLDAHAGGLVRRSAAAVAARLVAGALGTDTGDRSASPRRWSDAPGLKPTLRAVSDSA